MKILLTGAHFTPAQAVIEELNKVANLKISYVGRKNTQEGDNTPSVESEILPKLGVKFIPITTGRMRRILDFRTILSFLKIPIGFLQAPFILLREKPDVILSFGGYVAVPIVVWGWVLSIPIIVHEQTLVQGLANKVSSFFATKVAVTFSGVYKRRNLIVSGNPIRKELFYKNSKLPGKLKDIFEIDKDLPIIFITGGNQGSHLINSEVINILDQLVGIARVIHQTGDSKFQDFEKLMVQRERLKFKERYLVCKWFDVLEMGEILRKTSIVVSRAGANTLLELAYFEIPTLVIPLPFLYQDEQTKNAKYFEKLGLVKILTQKDLRGKRLLEDIKEMLDDYPRLKKQAHGSQGVVKLDAAKILVQELLVLASQHASS